MIGTAGCVTMAVKEMTFWDEKGKVVGSSDDKLKVYIYEYERIRWLSKQSIRKFPIEKLEEGKIYTKEKELVCENCERDPFFNQKTEEFYCPVCKE
jgi:hypothetical protein